MENRKFGLITLHDTLNYGSLLQTFGLYKTLSNLGVDVEIIDYTSPFIQKKESVVSFKLSDGIKGLAKYVLIHGDMKKKHDNFIKFLQKETKLSRHYEKDNLDETNNHYDSFIVGSDIVWGTGVTGHDFAYFLDFVKEDKKKYAFSPSVGVKWPESEYDTIHTLLNRFDGISVREQYTAEWISELFNLDVPVSCDPTMLLNSDEWDLYSDNKTPDEKYVLVYLKMSDEKNVKDAINYGKKHHLPVYYINFGKPVKGTKTLKPTTVGEWISLIKNADTVFTASYHGMLFSMYYHKKFFWYNRANRARMESFCKEFNIEQREGTDQNIENDNQLDYDRIEEIIQQKRAFSLKILRSYIGCEQEMKTGEANM